MQPLVPTTLRPLRHGAARITDGFLAELQDGNRKTSIPHGHVHLSEQQAWANLENAAARRVGEAYHGPMWEDGEVFKWLEAVAWHEGLDADEVMGRWLDDYSDLARRAQADDGYLSTFNQAAGKRGRYEWISYDHEIFNMATLIQAAVAQYRASGRTVLLDVACRAADHLAETFGFNKRAELCGHPLVEMALVELYRVTGAQRYLDLASYFVEHRGHGTLTDPTWQGWTSVYFSDRIPVRETVYPEGHAVRAVYFAAGATDVAIETGDQELLDALRTQWDNMVGAKMYVNGSLGSRWEGEAFGDPYELPNDRGYGETCAAVASIQWSWRLLLATGDAKYADLIERQLYNAVLSGVSLDGDKYFYVNALQVHRDALVYDGRMPANGRQPWFGTSCCPTNLMRTIATLHDLIATSSERGVQIHQFASAEVSAGDVSLAMTTTYPWGLDVDIQVTGAPEDPRELALRIPSWAAGATLTVNGDPVEAPAGDYARILRTWSAGDRIALVLPTAPRVVRGHPQVDSTRGAVAIERGPLVYAVEQMDQPSGLEVEDFQLVDLHMAVEWRDILGGVPAVLGTARSGPDGEPLRAVAIPYFMWANRSVGPMRVWLPTI
ncbi:MAG: glycoside hydrolase family 127 protein [Tessaracoccus sp.]|uniref:glycoside hydrolase family 127 protein n=1 Tax=Tessaracoccus sp. TaxID=1971211 RepID=UPI001EB6136C|nr:beta-L-arabinofuranosidase domain-containing protein [Tessaracoccus sp.]MBK7819957.1 glycoside hydrolase family 127 protein [Tessaracoccus sp.]